MVIIPAIDLIDGKCVRLIQGQYDRQITYKDDPVEQARQFHADGARWLHIVDLDGAKAGRPVNTKAIAAIVRATPPWRGRPALVCGEGILPSHRGRDAHDTQGQDGLATAAVPHDRRDPPTPGWRTPTLGHHGRRPAGRIGLRACPGGDQETRANPARTPRHERGPLGPWTQKQRRPRCIWPRAATDRLSDLPRWQYPWPTKTLAVDLCSTASACWRQPRRQDRTR